MSAHVVVIGGGITGLAAAHALVEAGAEVTVLERDAVFGGKVRATPFGGLPSVECGADVFLARTPAAVDLAARLGLGPELVAPAPLPAFVWSRNRLHPLPSGMVLGAPAAIWPLARSRILSWRGKLRAGLEPVWPHVRAGGPDSGPDAGPDAGPGGDSLGATIRQRFGDEVLERLVGPLVGGINAGDADLLSLRAVTPQLAEAAEGRRSLLLGLRAQQRRAAPLAGGSPFLAPRTGVSALVDRLLEDLGANGVELRHGVRVDGLERRAETGSPPGTAAGWLVATDGGPVEADAVVLATPAPVTAGLVATMSPDAAAALGGIRYASVAMVTLAVAEADVDRPLAGSGYLVPRLEQRTITACSWASSKWAHWHRPGQAILRVSAGRDGDERAMELDDAGLTEAILADLDRQIGLRGAPREVRITRWIDALPQYAPGHVDRVEAVTSELHTAAPGLHLAGAAYKGLGIPACIAQGQAAARAALATLGRG